MENTQVENVVTVDNATPTQVEKTFTQEQVNGFMQERINSIYNGYGVSNKAELDALIEKAKGFDEVNANYQTTKTQNEEYAQQNRTLAEKVAFIENNVNPERYDDVRAYFKGKEIEFNAENLLKELETHKEWLNENTTIKVGFSKTEQPKETEWEQAKKLFNL